MESAGTVDPLFHCDLLSLVAKDAELRSFGPASRSTSPTAPRSGQPTVRLLKRFPEHQIKYVVEGAEDMPEILEMLAGLGDIEPARVLLMAQSRTLEEVKERAPAIAALCLDHGFRYTPRLHLDLFGGGRGV